MIEINRVILMAKPPLLGRVKTRIEVSAGAENALQVYCALLSRTLHMMSELPEDFVPIVSWSSNSVKSEIDYDFDVWYQVDGDLGVRMNEAMNRSFKNGSGSTVLIGADCPDLTVNDVTHAFEILEDNDCVLGPTADGGYYLIGCNESTPAIFPSTHWGSSKVLRDTLSSLQNSQISYRLLELKKDIDQWEDWLTWKERSEKADNENGIA